jgi:hypothetical protein
MYDLFISYTSGDRPWAEQLYHDLRRRFPTLKVFWDRESIPAGDQYRLVIKRALELSSHFAVFWSEAAKASNEVGPEIEAFQEHQKSSPIADVQGRTLFYIPLEGKRGPLEDDYKIQGFVDLRKNGAYKVAEKDRGVSSLAMEPNQTEWNRVLRTIGDSIRAQDKRQPVNLVIVAMNKSNVNFIDNVLNMPLPFMEPTLKDCLDGLGLTLADAKSRYGTTAAEWQPFGTSQTVAEFMEDLRVEINRELDLQSLSRYRFYWTGGSGFDLAGQASTVKDETEFRGLLRAFGTMPSVVVVDPISLFNLVVINSFDMLLDCAQNEHWAIFSLYPAEMPLAVARLYHSLKGRGKTVLGGYFVPHIPAKGPFACCAVNIQDPMEVRRLIRGSLGQYYLAREKSPLPSGA